MLAASVRIRSGVLLVFYLTLLWLRLYLWLDSVCMAKYWSSIYIVWCSTFCNPTLKFHFYTTPALLHFKRHFCSWLLIFSFVSKRLFCSRLLIFSFVVQLNIFLAILVDAYSDVKDEAKGSGLSLVRDIIHMICTCTHAQLHVWYSHMCITNVRGNDFACIHEYNDIDPILYVWLQLHVPACRQ